MICRGKRKSIYRACEECKRGMKAIGGDSMKAAAALGGRSLREL